MAGVSALSRQRFREESRRGLLPGGRRFFPCSAVFRSITTRAPDLVGAWLGLARTLDALDDPQTAVSALAAARSRVGDGPELADVLFQQGVEFTRLLRFAEARDVYEQYVALALPDPARGTGLCNLAEIETYLHESDQSIDDYRRCIELRPGDPGGFWGLASAFDRSGRDFEARQASARALDMDPQLSGLIGPGVFFVPPYEIDYYLGLANEARGELAAALASWRSYLQRGGDRDAWAPRARAHVLRLERLQRDDHRRSIAGP